MKTALAIFISALLGLSIVDCSNSTSNPPPGPSWPPGVGTTYDVSEAWNNDPELTDTMHIVVDAINLHYQGRDSVSRLIRSDVGFNKPIGGDLFDTFYIHYLPSGDIETESSLADIKSFNYYPFATQHSLVAMDDTLIDGKLYRDTVSFSAAGTQSDTVSGKPFMAQVLNVFHTGFVDGIYGSVSETTSYFHALGYLGPGKIVGTPIGTSSSSQTLIDYNLK